MCTAPVMTSCEGGTCTVRKNLPFGVSAMPLLPRRMCFSITSLSIGRDVGGLDQALLAARHIGDDHRSAASGAFRVQRFKNLEPHDVVAPISVRPPPAGYTGRPPPQGGEVHRIRGRCAPPHIRSTYSPTPPSPHRRGWCRHRKARPSRPSPRPCRIRAASAF